MRPGGIDDVTRHMTSSSPPSHASHSGHHVDVTVGHVECLEAKCFPVSRAGHVRSAEGSGTFPSLSDGAGLNQTCSSIIFIGFWAAEQ